MYWIYHNENVMSYKVCKVQSRINRIVTVPTDLEDMRGYDGRTAKANMSDEFCFEFGTKGKSCSERENASKILYEALVEKSK